jgi:hypothetical protein
MEQLISNQPAAFNSSVVGSLANIDDNWIVEQIFSIRALEASVERALATSNGQHTASIRRQIAQLERYVAAFEASLESPKTPVRSLRARAS